LKHGSGELRQFVTEEGKECPACYETLEVVKAWIWERRRERNLPDLI